MIRKTDSVRILNGKIEIGGVVVATMVDNLPPSTKDMAEELLTGSSDLEALKDEVWQLKQQIAEMQEFGS